MFTLGLVMGELFRGPTRPTGATDPLLTCTENSPFGHRDAVVKVTNPQNLQQLAMGLPAGIGQVSQGSGLGGSGDEGEEGVIEGRASPHSLCSRCSSHSSCSPHNMPSYATRRLLDSPRHDTRRFTPLAASLSSWKTSKWCMSIPPVKLHYLYLKKDLSTARVPRSLP